MCLSTVAIKQILIVIDRFCVARAVLTNGLANYFKNNSKTYEMLCALKVRARNMRRWESSPHSNALGYSESKIILK